MMLLNPKAYSVDYQDPCFQGLVDKTINFFETKGLKQIKKDDQSMVWYDDFLTFVKQEKVFATLLTPGRYGQGDNQITAGI
jgi:acyl-CoA dehydrogenase